MVDIAALEARVSELSRQLGEAERDLVEARKTEVRFRYRYVVGGSAPDGGYIRFVLPRGVTLVAAPPGWTVGATRWSGRVRLGRTVTRDEPHEHVFSCAAPMSWARDHLLSTRVPANSAIGPNDGPGPSAALVPVPVAGALPGQS
jgi:hypothetical protein